MKSANSRIGALVATGISFLITDSSNIFASDNKPPVDGRFPDSVLSQTNGATPGHGQFIVNWLRQ
jgi:hypothetical protein